jgi:hypothetical protein
MAVPMARSLPPLLLRKRTPSAVALSSIVLTSFWVNRASGFMLMAKTIWPTAFGWKKNFRFTENSVPD